VKIAASSLNSNDYLGILQHRVPIFRVSERLFPVSGWRQMAENKKGVPWYLWPFWLIYQITLGILKITGRLLGAVLGLVILALGVLLCATVIGAILGVPLVILGVMLMVRSLF